MRCRSSGRWHALGLFGLLLAGCHAAPEARTTFLTSVDLVTMTDRMAESFASDEVLGARTPVDDPMIISLYRIVNHTNEVIPEREKWLYAGRLRAVLARSAMAERHSIIWIIPPDRWQAVADALPDPERPNLMRLDPTHVLTAEFNALTNTTARGRSDTYVCSYQLIDINTGSLTWEDSWEVKRSITGLTFD